MDDVARRAERRGRHGLPPLPDQGGADRGADGRRLPGDRRAAPRRRWRSRTRGRPSPPSLWTRRRDDGGRPRAQRGVREHPGAMESAMPTVEGLSAAVGAAHRPRPGGRRAARRRCGRRHPDDDVRDRQRHQEGAPLPGAWRRHLRSCSTACAPARRPSRCRADRPRRPRAVTCRDERPRRHHRSRARGRRLGPRARCSTATATIPARPSTRCSPPPRSAPTRSPPPTPARSPSSTARASSR